MSEKHQFAWVMSVASLTACALLAGAAIAAETPSEPAKAEAPDKSVLRVCAAANEAPYSTNKEDGFENRIAALLAESLGRKLEFVWSERPAIYLVRDQLDKGNCDVVIGVDAGDKRLLTTKPYYRAPYVFIERTDGGLDVTSFDDPDLMKAGKIGYVPGSPPEVMMVKLGLYGKNFNYVKSLTNFKSPRNQYVRIDPSRMVGDVASGTSDLAIAFAPEVARYVKENGKVTMNVVPDDNRRVDGEKIPFHFDQALGVRRGDEELRDELNAVIEKKRPDIQAILKDEGIPLQPVSETRS